MKRNIFVPVSVSMVTALLVLPGVVIIPAYSQTYDEWFEEGWNSGCADKTKGALNNTEGRNTPFTKGYNLGFAECLTGNTVNDTAVTDMTQGTDGSTTPATPGESAYDIGCSDAKLNGNERWVNQPGNEPSGEYYAGYYECGGTFPAESGFQPEPEPPTGPPQLYMEPLELPKQSGVDWITVCNRLQGALVSSCGVLVKPDNTLTTEGERAVGCIRNGIALAGGGTLLLSLPLPLVISALQILEEPTGCGGIVEWGAIGNVGDLKGIINLLT